MCTIENDYVCFANLRQMLKSGVSYYTTFIFIHNSKSLLTVKNAQQTKIDLELYIDATRFAIICYENTTLYNGHLCVMFIFIIAT